MSPEQPRPGLAFFNKKISTVKPDLTTTCEQRPPVNNGQFESSTTSINLNFIRHLCQTATFFWSRGWPLYTGLTVHHFLFKHLNFKISEFSWQMRSDICQKLTEFLWWKTEEFLNRWSYFCLPNVIQFK